jgi:hypothetical protein
MTVQEADPYDEELVDHFLDHHGVKGMHWGIRKRLRIERTAGVGRGQKGFIKKTRVYSHTNPIDFIRTGSLRKSAARKARRMSRRNERLATKGEAKVRDYLAEAGTARLTDILPSVRQKTYSADQKSKLRKMKSGKAFAIALPAVALYVLPKIVRQVSKAG